jgi:hypothetical protein
MARCNGVFKSKRRRRIAQLIGMLAFGMFVFSVWAGFHKKFGVPVVVFWTLGPPLYFCFEYFVLFDNWDSEDAIEELKHRQTLFSLFWAGIGGLLVYIYTR